jgi:hypothetical protein
LHRQPWPRLLGLAVRPIVETVTPVTVKTVEAVVSSSVKPLNVPVPLPDVTQVSVQRWSVNVPLTVGP